MTLLLGTGNSTLYDYWAILLLKQSIFLIIIPFGAALKESPADLNMSKIVSETFLDPDPHSAP